MTNSKNVKKLALALIAVGSLALAGCGGDSESKQDAPEPSASNIIEGTNTQVIKMPEGFRNVVFTCHGTVGLYVTSRGAYQNGMNADGLPSDVTAVPSHPFCVAK